jgi:MFS family permease
MRRGHANPLFSKRDGRVFLLSQSLNMVATGVAQVALPWLILDAGGSPAEAALVFTANVAPYLVFGLVAGLVGDRLPRRLVIALSHSGQAAVATLIPIWGFLGPPPVGVVLAVAFVIGTGRVFADSGSFGAIAAIAGRAHFTEAQATLSAAWATGRITGPALGGALIGIVGASTTVLVQAIAFGLSALLIVGIRTPLDPAERRPPEPVLAAIREGFAVIRNDPVIRTFTWMAACLTAVGMGSNSLMIPLLKEELGLSARQVGAVLATAAVSALFTAVVVPALVRRIGASRLFIVNIFIVAAAVLSLAVANTFWAALVAAAVNSLAFSSMVATWIGERQKRAPDHLQSRVGVSGRMLSMLGSTAGSATAGVLSGPIGVRSVFLVAAAFMTIVGLVMAPLLMRAHRIALAAVRA